MQQQTSKLDTRLDLIQFQINLYLVQMNIPNITRMRRVCFILPSRAIINCTHPKQRNSHKQKASMQIIQPVYQEDKSSQVIDSFPVLFWKPLKAVDWMSVCPGWNMSMKQLCQIRWCQPIYSFKSSQQNFKNQP